jgi:hypothetical protein
LPPGISIGNLGVQALAIGELASIAEVCELVDRSFMTQTYEPRAVRRGMTRTRDSSEQLPLRIRDERR